ncbi:unnamed protein product [Allacma fusca]|uniref:GPR180/TMEM145 transmembrane domain-containing protein n=1 Tax=Allacma fusca TaxID=39272 RepID=A0A8J2NYG6_9HEXA|nr:unnamed protein product [Allacma fusca]
METIGGDGYSQYSTFTSYYCPGAKVRTWKKVSSWTWTLILCMIFLEINTGSALHLKGTWDSDSFFLFLSKFGFQKTEIFDKNGTQGFIFGNVSNPFYVAEKKAPDLISLPSTTSKPKNASLLSTNSVNVTSSSNSSNINSTVNSSSSTTSPTTTTKAPYQGEFSYPGTFVVLDKSYFVDFYRHRNDPDKDVACQQMFDQIKNVNYDPHCFPDGKENFLRRIPCPKNGLCVEDLIPSDVVKDHQFTYAISDKTQAKFWYVSLVACYRDPKTCKWKHSRNYTAVQYDIWLVNGNPYTKAQNPLEYQFSFDRQDTVEIYLVFFVCYLVLVPLQVHAVLRQRHILPRLFTGSIALELTAVLSNVIHNLTFCLDGVGHPSLAVFGDISDILARAIFMLILLVLAKGWAVTRTELTSKPFIFGIWVLYGVIHILLYVWNQTEVDVIEDIDEYQTWPGWLILILRTIIMMWFVYELKDTMNHEHQPHKLNFFLHFGAAALVWFIYLPIVALIALQVSPLWRSKLLLGITYSADCFAFAVMTHLLWPTRSQQYFLLKTSTLDTSLTDELEEFNEAPHVVNPYARRSTHWYPVNYSFQDVSSPEAVSLTHANNLSNLSNGNHSYSDDKDSMPLIIT